MPLPMKAIARPRGASTVGRSPVILGQRKGKLAAELRSFARRAASPSVVPPLRRVNPSTSPRSRVRGGSFGPLSGLDASQFNARGQAILAEMRTGGTNVTSMAVPRLSDIGRMLTGGRKGVPAHVSPVKPPALTSLIPNLFNQSQVGSVLRGELRRRMGTRTMRPLAKPKRTR